MPTYPRIRLLSFSLIKQIYADIEKRAFHTHRTLHQVSELICVARGKYEMINRPKFSTISKNIFLNKLKLKFRSAH